MKKKKVNTYLNPKILRFNLNSISLVNEYSYEKSFFRVLLRVTLSMYILVSSTYIIHHISKFDIIKYFDLDSKLSISHF